MATPAVHLSIPPADKGQPSLPDLSVVAVGYDHKLLFKAMAHGVQKYPCDPATGAFGKSIPEAILVTDAGAVIHHFEGPTWQAADGSFVKGTVDKSAPAPDPDAIPWVKLNAVPGGTPGGMMSKVSVIQRVYTKLGKAPAKSCHGGPAQTPVFYVAEYYFWGLK